MRLDSILKIKKQPPPATMRKGGAASLMTFFQSSDPNDSNLSNIRFYFSLAERILISPALSIKNRILRAYALALPRRLFSSDLFAG